MRAKGVSLGAVDDELQSLLVDDVGLQPKLLANAVQPRGGGQSGNAAAHHLGDDPFAFLFLAAKIWRHARRVGISYSDHYAEQGIFQRLMDRLRAITSEGPRFRPVLAVALRE